ncbi:MAG TPA: PQQ-binding-like beta-propeller repeat protein [Actinoplanes sp.]|nr:PQQ-binding-like beta-propeller repeat protein [Actinoplanes sp.]
MTLIELDRDTPLDPVAGRPPPRLYRPLGLLVALVLAVLPGGAAPHSGSLWRYLGVIPPTAGVETPIQLAGGHLFTVAPAGARRILTAWTLEPAPARLWSADLPPSVAADPSNGAFIPVWVRQADDVVLVTAGMSTTAIESDSGRIRWTTGVRITVGDGGTGMVVDRIFRPGTVYDQDSGEPGMLYFSADGQPHTEPPIRTEVRGVDLATGRTLWTAGPAGSVLADPVPGDHPAVLITASDRLTLHDARTGAVLHETVLPERSGAGPSTSDVLGGVVLVGYDEAGLQAGYDTSTLRLLWTRDLQAEMDPPSCAGLLCAGSRDSTEVLDPSTGRPLWALPSAADLDVAVGHVLHSDPSSGAPVRLHDPATGASWVELTGWTDVVESFADVLVMRRADQTGGQAFGIVRPGRPEVRTLGVADLDGQECGADDRFVVCRDVQGLRIWAYRV